MSSTSAAWIVAGVVAACLPVAYWQIRLALRHDAARDDYISPNDPRLPAQVNAHLDHYAATDPQLAPVFAPGINRLRQAIRDEQQKGD